MMLEATSRLYFQAYYIHMHQMVIQLNPTHSTHTCHYFYKKMFPRTSLVVHWIRIHLPMQGTWVRFLVQEDSIC